MLFRQACARIPKGAVCLEVGPHAILRSPLRQNRHAYSSVAAQQFGRMRPLPGPLVAHAHAHACACTTVRSAFVDSACCLNRPDVEYVAAMRKGENGVETVRAAIADLWLKGAAIKWPASAAGKVETGQYRCFLLHACSTADHCLRVLDEALGAWKPAPLSATPPMPSCCNALLDA